MPSTFEWVARSPGRNPVTECCAGHVSSHTPAVRAGRRTQPVRTAAGEQGVTFHSELSIVIGVATRRTPFQRRLRRLFGEAGWRPVLQEDGGAVPECDVLVIDIDRLRDIRDRVPTLAVTSETVALDLVPGTVDVRAIVDRDDLDGSFLNAVHEIASGHGWISPTLVRSLLRPPSPADSPAHRAVAATPYPARLTAREREVVALVTSGLNNGEIAATLHVAESTVKFHVSNILHKTGCRDRSQLTAHARALVPRTA